MEAIREILESSRSYEKKLLALMALRTKSDPHFTERYEPFSEEAVAADQIVRSSLNAIRNSAHNNDFALLESKYAIFGDPSFVDEEVSDRETNAEVARMQYEIDLENVDSSTEAGLSRLAFLKEAETYVAYLQAQEIASLPSSIQHNAGLFEIEMAALESYLAEYSSLEQLESLTADDHANLELAERWYKAGLSILQKFEFKDAPDVLNVEFDLSPASMHLGEFHFLNDVGLLGKCEPYVTREVEALNQHFEELKALEALINSTDSEHVTPEELNRRYVELPALIHNCLGFIKLVESARDFAVLQYGTSREIQLRTEAKRFFPSVNEEYAEDIKLLPRSPREFAPEFEDEVSSGVTSEELAATLEKLQAAPQSASRKSQAVRV